MTLHEYIQSRKCDACGTADGQKYSVNFILIAESRHDESALISHVDGRLCRGCRTALIGQTMDFMKGAAHVTTSN